MRNLDLILGPIISEKSMKDAGANKFTFRVNLHSDKNKIRKAIEDKFKVNVLKVSTIIVKGGKKRQGTRRIEVSKRPWKKAIVKVKDGQKIDLFDVGGKKK